MLHIRDDLLNVPDDILRIRNDISRIHDDMAARLQAHPAFGNPVPFFLPADKNFKNECEIR